MSRPLRIEFAGALYHVTARGNARQDIFHDEQDRASFLSVLSSVVARQKWRVHAYCLMGNHYHLLVETPECGLSEGMRQLNGVYAQRFNRRRDRVGHLFQGRFHSVLVDREEYLLIVARYVVLNPVRAGIVDQAEAWKWSSYRATVGLASTPDWLTTGWLLSNFGSTGPAAATSYVAFVAAGGVTSPWKAVRGGVLLGTNAVPADVAAAALAEASAEVPRRERWAQRPSLAEILASNDEQPAPPAAAIRAAYLQHRYTLTEVGSFLGLHYGTISRIVNGVEWADRKRPRRRPTRLPGAPAVLTV